MFAKQSLIATAISTGIALYSFSTIAAAQVINADPSSYKSLISTLQPGDTLQLAAGNYTQGFNISDLHGESGNPIVLSGPESGDPAVILGRSCCNTVQFGLNSYVTVRYLTLDGQDIDYIDAVNSQDVTHNITIEHLTIIHHGGSGPDTDSQYTVGISTKAPAWDWTIRHNTIIGAGTGMYLGNSDGNFPFVRGLVEYNVILDTWGYNMQIKHQNPRPTNIGMPTGDNKTIIRHNVFSKENNASMSGTWARPNLLLGHFPRTGTGSNDLYEVYGNFFFQNPSEALFQGEGHIAMYNNLFVHDQGTAINVMPHNDVPKNISIFNNTVVANGTGIRVSGPDSNYSQRVTGNAVFSNNPLALADNVTESENVTDAYGTSVNYLLDPTGAVNLDLYPVNSMLSGANVDTSPLMSFTDWNKDFNGDQRDGSFYGAYTGEGSNPGWSPQRAIKNTVASSPPPEPQPEPEPEATSPDASDAAGGGSLGTEIIILLFSTIFTTVFRRRNSIRQ